MITRVQNPGSSSAQSVAVAGTPQVLDELFVASLTTREISSMSCENLVRIIRAMRLPMLRADVNRNLDGCDRPTLERLVYLTQRTCRHQLGGDDYGLHHTPWDMASKDSDTQHA